MEAKLIARDREIEELKTSLESDESEFVIVYGRRRVGKTFLIEEFFNRTYDFKFVGGHNMPISSQLNNFRKALKKYSGEMPPEFSDWSEAFDALEEWIESIDEDRKKIIFFDEMPWIDHPDSDFVQSLEYFWNSWAAGRDDILFLATGSSTSWMIDNLLENQGGLYNRITTPIYLSPFNLRETEMYLRKKRVPWNRYQILQCYMITGGVPYYLKLFNAKLSVAQNIDNLCYQPKGKLRMEFDELYPALFADSELYLQIAHLLYEHQEGLTRTEIFDQISAEGSKLTQALKNLERSDFIARRSQFGNKKKDAVYRLVDYYSIFYFNFIENDHTLNPNWWINNMNSPEVLGWMGRTFELICLQHHQQIKQALGISGISTEVSTWRQKGNRKEGIRGAQIDMVIERADPMIHLCEMKFSIDKFTLTPQYEEHLRNRMRLFQEATGTKKTPLLTFVTTYGLSNPTAYSTIHSDLTMDSLFNP